MSRGVTHSNSQVGVLTTKVTKTATTKSPRSPALSAGTKTQRKGSAVTVKSRSRNTSHTPQSKQPMGRRTGLFLMLFISVMALVMISVVMGLSATAAASLSNTDSAWSMFRRHLIWACLGAAALVVMMRIDYHHWKPVALVVLILGLLMLAVTAIPAFGLSANGATRWIGIGPLTFQPSEPAKLALVLFIADLLSRPERSIADSRATLRPVLIVAAVMIVLLMRQPHLGGSMMVVAISVVMLWFAGTRLSSLVVIGLVGIAGAATMVASSPWRRARLTGFLNPWDDPLGNGYQPLQSLHAMASGGITGVGLGEGRAKWGFLPYAHTDFIFAVIGEELGLLGTLFVTLLFVLLGVAGFCVALKAPDRFGMLLAVGLTSWMMVQVVLNYGAVLAVFPVVGMTLPLLSFGGSSLVTTMAAMGLLLNVARQTR